MADLRSTIGAIKKRKKMLDEAMEDGISQQAQARGTTPPKAEPDLLSPESIEAELKKQQAAKKKKGWW
jgi:hypothetical protein